MLAGNPWWNERFAFLYSYLPECDINNTWSHKLHNVLNFDKSRNALARPLNSKSHVNYCSATDSWVGEEKKGRWKWKDNAENSKWSLATEVKYMESKLGGSLFVWVLMLPLYPPYPTPQAHHALEEASCRPTSPSRIPAPETLSQAHYNCHPASRLILLIEEESALGNKLIFHYKCVAYGILVVLELWEFFRSVKRWSEEFQALKLGCLLGVPEAFSEAVCTQGQPGGNAQPALSTSLMILLHVILLQ